MVLLSNNSFFLIFFFLFNINMLKNKIILFFVEKNTCNIVNKKKSDYTILFYWDILKET